MRNLTYILAFLFIGWSANASVKSQPATLNNYYNDSFIFVEDGVEFAIYPNGEFDFYYNPEFRRGNSVHISTPNMNISYNSGYNYEPYVQYDDYGAVIQIESVPVYYDYYGRIIQAGDIFINYNNFGRIARIGNLHLHYDHFQHYTHSSGFINYYNRQYVYRPWHDYYRRPFVNVSIVFNRPYRAYYQPHRYSYNQYVTVYNNYYSNHTSHRNFYRPSDRVASYNYGARTTQKRDLRSVRTRSNNDVSNSRQSVARSREAGNNRAGSYESKRSGTYTSNGDRTTTRRSSGTQSEVYSGRNERSSDGRGRSSRTVSPQQKREVTRQSSSRASRPQNTVKRESRGNVQRSVETSSNKRAVRSTRNTPERNAQVKRQTRQRSSSARSSTSRAGSPAVERKNSSRTRSSARNVNNK